MYFTPSMMKHHDQKQIVEKKRFIWLQLPHNYSSLNKVRTGTHTGQEQEAGVNAEATEGYYLLHCSSDFAQLAFYGSWVTSPK